MCCGEVWGADLNDVDDASTMRRNCAIQHFGLQILGFLSQQGLGFLAGECHEIS